MTNSIPKPEFPEPRKRRSSIAQAAAAVADGETATSGETPGAPQSRQPDTGSGGQSRGGRASTRTGGGAPRVESSNKRLVGSRDILLSLPEDLKERMVNTMTWAQPHTGIGQQQKFIRKAILDLCERLERDLNQGNPYPAPRRTRGLEIATPHMNAKVIWAPIWETRPRSVHARCTVEPVTTWGIPASERQRERSATWLPGGGGCCCR